jgi:hypothetical protein
VDTQDNQQIFRGQSRNRLGLKCDRDPPCPKLGAIEAKNKMVMRHHPLKINATERPSLYKHLVRAVSSEDDVRYRTAVP